jgi:outer membrane protein W
MQPVQAEKFQISLLGGLNHVFPYGSEEDYALGLNDFPVTPSHTPLNFCAAFALYLTGKLALELDWRYTLSSKLTLRDPSDQDEVEIDSSKHHSFTLNLLYRFLQGKIKPYIVAGGGVDKICAKDATYTTGYGFEIEFLAPEKTIDPLVNVGAGILFDVSSSFGLRLDLRYVMIFAEPDSIGSVNAVAGITYSF